MSTYKVGSGTQQIKLSVDIDTIGLAASRAIVLDPDTADPPVTVGKSLDASGDIPRKDIGSATLLKKKRFSVLTKIDLLGSQAECKKEAERITAKYIFDDGSEGHKVFDDPEKTISDDFTTVILFKDVDLNP